MRRALAQIFFIFLSLSLFAEQRLIDGSWHGNLGLGNGRSVKLVFHVTEGPEITMDSPDQGAKGIPLDITYISDDSLSCCKSALMMKFGGKLVGDKIEGMFSQRGFNIPLVLKKGDGKVNRPQTPLPPFPYIMEDVVISNDSVSLSATLSVPEGADSTTPVVLMITGSGLQNRDEEMFEHKPFAVIADYLARHGIASLRYDDRGFGESTGQVLNATTIDFADDAKMAVEWLRSRHNKTGKLGKIGILGHSEGGMIAYMLGAEKSLVDFIVSIAGPSIQGSKTIAYQNKVALTNSGIDEQTADDFAAALESALNYKTDNPTTKSIGNNILAELYPQYNQNDTTTRLADTIRKMMSGDSSNEWMMYFLAYNPASDMKRVKIPAFIIYGENDKQVPPSLNLAPAKEYIPAAKIKCYPELNHIMQHSVTGNVEEYSSIEETISPEVLEDITTFIQSVK